MPSAQNPSDMLSRGTTVEELFNNKLWWNGPQWLPHEDQWPETPANMHMEVPELRTRTVLVSSRSQQDILLKYSSFDKLKRIIAYCLRMKGNPRDQCKPMSLTPEELQGAELTISRMVQQDSFFQEYQALQQGKQLQSRSQLLTLNPFLDEDRVIRVGGRLRHADVPDSQKHSIVLPTKHHITEIILRQEP